MRQTCYTRLRSSFSRLARPARVASLLLSGLALALLTGNLWPGFQWANAGSGRFRLEPKAAAAGPSGRSWGTAFSTPRKVGEQFDASPLRFEENRGQASKDVRFLARANGAMLFLTRSAAVLTLPLAQTDEPKLKSGPPQRLFNRTGIGTVSHSILRLELAHHNPNVRPLCSELLPGVSNYFLRDDPTRWITHVPNCAKVRYENVYPGIDLVYYGNHQQLEYDYILAPGADPDRVHLRLRGPRSIRLSDSGDLMMDFEGGKLFLRKPLAYQIGKNGKERILARYALRGTNLVGLDVGAYDHHLPLVIDPVLTYSTYLGGSGGDTGTAVRLDSSGNMYLVGTTSSLNFPTTPGVLQSSIGGVTNAFVAKLSPAGTPVFSTYLGGAGSNNGACIAVDSAGDVYITGMTSSADFPTTAGVVQNALKGPSDAFVAKLSSTGASLIYSTYLGGTGSDTGTSIAVDSSGSAYITGATASADFPTTSGSFQTTFGGVGTSSNAFITKLSPDATTLAYSSFLGGSGLDSGAGLAVDSSGEAFVTGTTSSTNFPTLAPLQATLAGETDAFVTKINSAGTAMVFSTYLGGQGADQGSALALDGSGNVYVTGATSSNNFPTMGPLQSTLAGSTNAFVSELQSNGSALVYSTYLGGSGSDSGNGIAVDSSGNAYVVGMTLSSDFPIVNPIETRNSSSSDAFVTEVANGGASLTFSSYLGGSENDTAAGVAVDPSGNIYVIGTTASSDFPVTLGSFQPVFGKVSNVFVSIIGSANQPALTVYPAQLTFSPQGVGTTSNPKVLAIRNMGSGVLNTTSIATTGGFGETNTCGGVVGEAAQCAVSVTFSPTARGTQTGTVVFSDNAAGSPQTLTLTGTGVSPIINLSSTTLTFPSEPLNTTAPTQTVSMNNSGVDPSTITAITTSGDFTQTNTCGTGLAAGATCTITVAFTPTLNGTRTGTLSVVDNSAGSPHTVSLTGTGVGPDVSLSASALTFGEQPLGTTSGPQIETLTNDGSAAMTIAGIQTTGAFAQSNNCGTSLKAAANCTINVTFKPTAAGIDSGALTILDNAPGNPHTVVLSGDAVTGSAPVVYLSPAPLSFGPQPDGTTGSFQTLTLKNTGNAILQITNTSLTGSFSLGTNSCSRLIAGGGSCTAQIASAPSAPGPTSGSYLITDNASGSPHVVNITGSGTDFDMSAIPATATVNAGQSATYTLTLTPVYGFNQTISLSCGNLPQATTCAFNPATETLDGTDAATVTVTVSTTARSMLGPGVRRPQRLQFVRPFGKLTFGLFLMLALTAVLSAARSNRRAWLLVGMVLLALSWVACDVSTQTVKGTLAGSYAFSLTGSYAANGTLQHSLRLGLSVN